MCISDSGGMSAFDLEYFRYIRGSATENELSELKGRLLDIKTFLGASTSKHTVLGMDVIVMSIRDYRHLLTILEGKK